MRLVETQYLNIICLDSQAISTSYLDGVRSGTLGFIYNPVCGHILKIRYQL